MAYLEIKFLQSIAVHPALNSLYTKIGDSLKELFSGEIENIGTNSELKNYLYE